MDRYVKQKKKARTLFQSNTSQSVNTSNANFLYNFATKGLIYANEKGTSNHFLC